MACPRHLTHLALKIALFQEYFHINLLVLELFSTLNNYNPRLYKFSHFCQSTFPGNLQILRDSADIQLSPSFLLLEDETSLSHSALISAFSTKLAP